MIRKVGTALMEAVTTTLKTRLTTSRTLTSTKTVGRVPAKFSLKIWERLWTSRMGCHGVRRHRGTLCFLFFFLISAERKRRARSPTSFGLMLSQALEASEKSNATGPSTTLHPATRQANRIAKQQAASESQRKQTAATRHELQERGHIKDVIGGWTPRPAVPFSEWLVQGDRKWSEEGAYVGGASQEKTLRRLAQTGVVKLFNAIRAAQNVDDEDAKASLTTLSGAQKRKLNKLVGDKLSKKAAENPDPAALADAPEGEPSVGRFKPNVLGSRGKDEALANLSKATFLELIKSGGKPS
ncbi:hypothetical protein, variant [Puccinia triticina 1-1 BBBD Race 1]|uniref:Uncharacterized protein n=1 Tax=Puccinia triticina (isolate 1-1 / race 1 (BBBD)) TaxID=630390 RepID=A0A180GGS2_PUCT1|nr:hypothetical protein, variant [Puccinia triticina 1-1 BBBD Race 1]